MEYVLNDGTYKVIYIYGKGVYYDVLSLAYLNFANSDPSSRNKATVDVLLLCIINPPPLEVSFKHISVGLSSCSFYDGWQCEGQDMRSE